MAQYYWGWQTTGLHEYRVGWFITAAKIIKWEIDAEMPPCDYRHQVFSSTLKLREFHSSGPYEVFEIGVISWMTGDRKKFFFVHGLSYPVSGMPDYDIFVTEIPVEINVTYNFGVQVDGSIVHYAIMDNGYNILWADQVDRMRDFAYSMLDIQLETYVEDNAEWAKDNAEMNVLGINIDGYIMSRNVFIPKYWQSEQKWQWDNGIDYPMIGSSYVK